MPKRRKHRPPSQVRYDKTHPIISFRVDQKTKQRLKKVLEKQSFAGFIKEALGVREREKKSLEDERKKMYRMGYSQAKNVYGIRTQCDICDGEIIISGNSKDYIESRLREDYLRRRGYVHTSCEEK